MKVVTSVGQLLDFIVNFEQGIDYDKARTLINELLVDECVLTTIGSCKFVRMYGTFDNITPGNVESTVVVSHGKREVEFNDFDVVCTIIIK